MSEPERPDPLDVLNAARERAVAVRDGAQASIDRIDATIAAIQSSPHAPANVAAAQAARKLGKGV